MEAFNRKTEYWITPTPSKVGPGSYNVSPDREHRQISAPFVSNQVRSLNNSIQKNNEPGPGSYGKITDWKHDKNNRGIGFTSLPREIKYPNKHGVLTAISAGVSPGPGSYATLEAPQKRPKIQQRTKPVSLVLEPTSVSIPTKIAVEQPLGPYSYTPNYSKIKPCVITSDFSLSKTERNELFQTNEIPGPGQYENKEIRTNKVGWAFRSKVKRKSMDTIESPGPAAYSPQLNDFHTNSLYSCFGTTADRNMPVSNDPHRPYICGNKAGPPVGAYEKDSKKIERKILKPRFSQTSQEKAKIGFNVTEKRELKLAQNEFVPGPGNYELSKDEQDAKSIIFSCHSARFKDNKNPESPGPGSYENPNGNWMRSGLSSLMSKTTRFDNGKELFVNSIGENIATEFHIGHKPWKMKKGSVNFSALTGMGSSIRFSNPKDAENPGPGHYYPDSSSYRSQSHTLTEQRFSNFANYTSQHGTSHEIGPGAYHNDSVPYKRTFNASGELAEHKPWI